jgi:hypothetical protein
MEGGQQDLLLRGAEVSAAEGRLAENIAYFARALRTAGLPVGPGAVTDAIRAVEAARIGEKQDFYWTLHAVFVKKHEHSPLFDQAFRLFWRRRAFLDKLMAMLSPVARAPLDQDKKPEAGARRIADAFQPKLGEGEKPKPQEELDARMTVSDVEVLKSKDFAQMTAAEIAAAKALIAKLQLPDDRVATRRFTPSHAAHRIDLRRTFRRTLRDGGLLIDLAFRERAEVHPPIVALCDISGSMAEYTRVFLHFLHVLAERRRVHTFLFATRLTNVTRELRAKDPDDALAACTKRVMDWDGGTRLAGCLHDFNRLWSRRVLTQGPVVLLFSDGLERKVTGQLAFEADRLHRSCRRFVWLNPLLRYDGFEARAEGIRTILPHVDEMRPIHNLRNMADLVQALRHGGSARFDPKRWLKAA